MGWSEIDNKRLSFVFQEMPDGDLDKIITFCDTTNRLSGATFSDLQSDQIKLAKNTWSERKNIKQGGLLKYVHGEEFHAYNPDVVKTLQDAVKSGDYEDYKKYSDLFVSEDQHDDFNELDYINA